MEPSPRRIRRLKIQPTGLGQPFRRFAFPVGLGAHEVWFFRKKILGIQSFVLGVKAKSSYAEVS